jgi:hypothetical protein
MPYVQKGVREFLNQGIPITNPGNLNYLITMLIKRYWEESSGNYVAINDIVGALEGAKLEFYRRIAAPYEDKKIVENGDVYNG